MNRLLNNTNTTVETLKDIYAKNWYNSKIHIMVSKTFAHKNFRNPADRMELLKCIFQSGLKSYYLHHNMITQLFKKNILLPEEREFVLNYAIALIHDKLKQCEAGVLFKNGSLKSHEMTKVLKYCITNKINIAYIDLDKYFERIIKTQNLEELQQARNILYEINSVDLFEKMFYHIPYRFKRIGVDKTIRSNTMNKAYHEFMSTIHQEKILIKIFKTPLQKLRYLIYFDFVMEEHEQLDFIQCIMDKKINTLLKYTGNVWYGFSSEHLKGKAKDLCDSLEVFHKIQNK